MSEPYHATVRVLPTDAAAEQEQAGPIVIEIIIHVQQDAPASGPSIPVEPPPLPAGLTPREQEVFTLLAQSYTNAEIADALIVAPGTIKFHVENILSKLGVHSRREVIRMMQQPAGGPS